MKLSHTLALTVVGLLLGTSGCASRPLARWRPGIYHYRSSLAGTGEVGGSIEVGAEGPVGVSSTLGACDERIETTPREMRERLDGELVERTFICGTDYRLLVALSRDGAPPIQGTISNQRTDTVFTFGEAVCKQWQVIDSEEGKDRVCVAWDSGPRMRPRTTGATARWWLVANPFAPPP